MIRYDVLVGIMLTEENGRTPETTCTITTLSTNPTGTDVGLNSDLSGEGSRQIAYATARPGGAKARHPNTTLWHQVYAQ